MLWLFVLATCAHLLVNSRRSDENAAVTLTLISMFWIFFRFLFSGLGGGLIPSVVSLAFTFVVHLIVCYLYILLLSKFKNNSVVYFIILIAVPILAKSVLS